MELIINKGFGYFQVSQEFIDSQAAISVEFNYKDARFNKSLIDFINLNGSEAASGGDAMLLVATIPDGTLFYIGTDEDETEALCTIDDVRFLVATSEGPVKPEIKLCDTCSEEEEEEEEELTSTWVIIEYEFFTCENCGNYHNSQCDTTDEANDMLSKGEVPNYCSNCGARMVDEIDYSEY